MKKTRVMLTIEITPDRSGHCDLDCTVCCNQAGDREWVAKCAGINEGHEDTRGPECYAAEQRSKAR